VTHRWPVVAATAVWFHALAAPLTAQTTASLEVGGSLVQYDGFLSSGAVYGTPMLRLDGRTHSVAAQGSYILFESGSRILQGTAAGGWLTPRFGPWRGELSASAGVTGYQDYPSYGHVLGRGKLHLIGDGIGAWVAGATGSSFFGSNWDGATEVAVGAWAATPVFGGGVTLTHYRFLDTTFTDVVAGGRWRTSVAELDGSLGIRTSAVGSGNGLYGDLGARFRLSSRFSILASGGRYPADPVRGVLAASYANLGLRFDLIPSRRTPLTSLSAALRRVVPAAADRGSSDDASLAIEPSTVDLTRIRVSAPGAARVELMGDFTDWEPLTLASERPGLFEIVLRLAPGSYRLNVRLDGGRWIVPGGARVEEDDFGQTVGIVLVQ
jgi:hypothetical protein